MRITGSICSALLLAAAAFATPASAANTVLYTFCPSATCTGTQDGLHPNGAVVKDGNRIYGATTDGGANAVGTIYRYNVSTAVYTKIFDFTTSGPNSPEGALIMDSSGNLYGAASAGGTHSGGAIYRLNKPSGGGGWTLTTLYNFCTTTSGSICTDGKGPIAGLAYSGQSTGSQYDGTSLLFGTTLVGGASDKGTAFALQLSGGIWSEKVIHDFGGPPSDGQGPGSSMWMDASSNLWGTTQHGGSASKGMVFKLTHGANLWTDPWTETVLYNACWTAVTKCPDASLLNGIILSGSTIYGTAELGGNGSGTQGGGVIFKLTNPGGCTEGGVATFYCLTVLWNFCTNANCTDGFLPAGGTSLIQDASGNLYGGTSLGGTGAGGFPGGGVVYEYSGAVPTILANLCTGGTCSNGEGVNGTLLLDGTTLYGVSGSGGDVTTLGGVLWSVP